MTKEEILYIFAKYMSGHDENRKIYETRLNEIADEILQLQAKNLQKAPVSSSVCEHDYTQTTAGWQCKLCGNVMCMFY